MNKGHENVTRNCRYLDGNRRTHIPASVLAQAGIEPGGILDFIAVNGCVVARPVVGITVPNHSSAGKFIKLGKNQ